MAFKYPECEYCSMHGNHDFCDECEEGDGFEPIDRHRKTKKFPPTVAQAISVSSIKCAGRHPTQGMTDE